MKHIRIFASLALSLVLAAGLLTYVQPAQAASKKKNAPLYRNLLKVLDGTLARGGGPGGKRPMSREALMSLCEQGYSSAIYLYAAGFSETYGNQETVDCMTSNGPNKLTYESIAFRDRRRQILERIHSNIVSGTEGPIFVHCWNGKHAAGEIAALALRQFCDYSGERGASYWMANIFGDKPDGYSSPKHIRKFTPYDDLKISRSLQSRVCPY